MNINTIYFCPKCQQPTVDASPLVGGSAKCRTCGWSGQQVELLCRDVEGPPPEELVKAFSNDLKLLIAENVAIPLARFLQKWGFLTAPTATQKDQMMRYMSAATFAVAMALLEQRDKEAKLEQAAGPKS